MKEKEKEDEVLHRFNSLKHADQKQMDSFHTSVLNMFVGFFFFSPFCCQERYKHQSNILPNYVPLGHECFVP